MSRGTLNRRLELEAQQRNEDGAGGARVQWQSLGTLWAAIHPRSARMASGETGAVSRAGFRIIVRGAPQGASGRPGPGQRFRMGQRLFRVEAVTEMEPDGLYLICECEEEVLP